MTTIELLVNVGFTISTEASERLERTRGGIQGVFPQRIREGFSGRSDRPTVGSNRRGLRLLDGGEGSDVPARGENHRSPRYGRQRRANGLREYRRHFRHWRLLYARP